MSFKNKEFLIEWNSLFPLDRWWRKKNNVTFNSKQHRETSYIDIFYEWLEDSVFDDHFENLGKEEKRKEHYRKTGEWIIEEFSKEKEKELIDLFDNMDISQFNE